jgi:hypothetical protein
MTPLMNSSTPLVVSRRLRQALRLGSVHSVLIELKLSGLGKQFRVHVDAPEKKGMETAWN